MDTHIHTALAAIHRPITGSHKGQNGRLLIIGGSHLFHSASMWALQVASRLVDLVHYASVPENNAIIAKLKEEFHNGIVVPRTDIEAYIEEDDCILIGPGMVRTDSAGITNHESRITNIQDIEKIEDEGEQTYYLTKYLLQKYPKKKWVIDAGALQMLELEWIPEDAILTPHHKEFAQLAKKAKIEGGDREAAHTFAERFHCTVLLKGEKDTVASAERTVQVEGGNAGMTKGGTGDVLAGLIAGLYCTSDAWSATVAASYINKKAGDDLYTTMGYWFNASDLAGQIPKTMKNILP